MGKKKETIAAPVKETKVKKQKESKKTDKKVAKKESKKAAPKLAKTVGKKTVAAPVAEGGEKPKKRVNRDIRYLVKGPYHTTIKRWIKKEFEGVRIHTDAMSIFEGNLDFLQSRFLDSAVAALSSNSKRKTLSRKDGRYAIANILGKPEYSDLQLAVLNAEAEAIGKYKEAVAK